MHRSLKRIESYPIHCAEYAGAIFKLILPRYSIVLLVKYITTKISYLPVPHSSCIFPSLSTTSSVWQYARLSRATPFFRYITVSSIPNVKCFTSTFYALQVRAVDVQRFAKIDFYLIFFLSLFSRYLAFFFFM